MMRRLRCLDVLWCVGVACLMGLLLVALPVQADGGLPPRETPTPVPSGAAKGDDAPVGARIELRATGAPGGAWAGVQWQDSIGGWRDVEGWQGSLSVHGCQSWWVAARDFGCGPFRWVVLEGPGGALLASSAPFDLPGASGEVLVVEVGMRR
jgi:hypothetical protein